MAVVLFGCLAFAPLPAVSAGMGVQSDWSGGPGLVGPVTDWSLQFQSSSQAAWRTFPGTLLLAGVPIISPVQHVIAGNGEHPDAVAVGDINGDGFPDVVSPDAVTSITPPLGAVLWWERTPSGSYIQHFVDQDFYGARYVDVYDVDLDGDMDVLAAAYFGVADPPPPSGMAENGRYAWFENIAGDGSVWEQHLVGELFNGANTIAAGDLDNDGDIDLAGTSELTDGIFIQESDVTWFENTDGVGRTWAQHELELFSTGTDVHIADIDGDGDNDVVAGESGRISWYQNINGDGSEWLTRTVSASLSNYAYLDVGDMDLDGDIDIVGGAYGSTQVAWWENVAGTGSIWFPRYVVDASFGRSIALGDIDGDGDLDGLIAKSISGGAGGVWWLENESGDGIVWNPRALSTGFQNHVYACLADANADGRLNAVVSDEDFDSVNGQQLSYFELTSFQTSGWLVSSILEAGPDRYWRQMDWDATLPGQTTVSFEVRAGENPLNLGPFLAAGSSGDDLADVIDPRASYLQYRAVLSTTSSLESPILEELRAQRPLLGDVDADGILDLADYGDFADCFAGPGQTPAPGGGITVQQCLTVFDAEPDGDVDLADFAAFATRFNQPEL